MKQRDRKFLIAVIATWAIQLFCIISVSKFSWFLIGWTLISSLVLFTFEVLKPFAKNWFDREDKYPITDGIYICWIWFAGFLLTNINDYLIFAPYLIMKILQRVRVFLEPKIGRKRAVNIDAILSSVFILTFIIWFISQL